MLFLKFVTITPFLFFLNPLISKRTCSSIVGQIMCRYCCLTHWPNLCLCSSTFLFVAYPCQFQPNYQRTRPSHEVKHPLKYRGWSRSTSLLHCLSSIHLPTSAILHIRWISGVATLSGWFPIIQPQSSTQFVYIVSDVVLLVIVFSLFCVYACVGQGRFDTSTFTFPFFT